MTIRRRELAKSALFAAIFARAPLALADSPAAQTPATSSRQRRIIPWRNWSGWLQCEPAARHSPRDEQELIEVLKTAVRPLRPIGSGHSFSPLIPTDGSLISLHHFTGVDIVGDRQAEVGAGTPLGQLGKPLHDAGQALINMPDIDQQTLAGALATATHGTGRELGALHAYVDALRLVTPGGDIIDCSRERESDIFQAALVSLGSLGIITRYTLNNMATYKLKRRTWLEPLDSLLERFDELADQHRTFEMYYVPFGGMGLAITTDLTDEPISPRLEDGDDDAVRELKRLRDLFGWWPGLRRWLLSRFSREVEPEEHVDWWWNIYPTVRGVPFNEMEYHLPRDAITATLRQVRERVENHHPDVFFPMEIRVVKADDAWLSPFYKRDSASLAVHRYFEEDPLPLFSAVEPLLKQQQGRPHWGKMHTLNSTELSALYPRWQDFQAVRKALDPEGIMLNTHLKTVFGYG